VYHSALGTVSVSRSLVTHASSVFKAVKLIAGRLCLVAV
jgi:hypothetical protein